MFAFIIGIMLRQKTFLQETLDLLKKDKRKLPQIAKSAGVGYFWLRSLKSGACKNPRILHVQRLRKELSK